MQILTKIKKNKDLLLYSLLISIFMSIPFFQNGILVGHDMTFHMSRITGIISAIQDRQFPLAIYPYKNFGYGYASPLFYSDLFLIIPAILYHITPISLVTLYKILLFIIIFFTSFTTMYTINKIFNNKLSSILAAIILVSSEYYLVDYHVRSAFGELLATSLLPLLFYFVYEFIVEEKNNYLSLGIIFALLVNSHNITFLLSVITFGLFIIFNINKFINNKKMFITLFKATLIGFLLSFAFLIPLLEQYTAQYLRVQQSIINEFGADAIKLSELFMDFFSQYNFKFNNYLNNEYVGSIKNLGLLCTIIPFIYLFVKKNKYINQLFVLFILYLYMSTEFFPIEKVSFLNFLQFSPRFYIILPLFVSYICAYTINKIDLNKSKIIVGIVCLYVIINSLFLFTALMSDNIQNRFPENATAQEIFEEEKYFKDKSKDSNWNWYELGNGEYLPDRHFLYPKEERCIDDVYSNHISCEYERQGTYFKFTLDLDEEKIIQLPLSWYKGYYIDEVDESGNVINHMHTFASEYRARLSFDGLKGKHTYISKYKGTKIQKLSCLVSLISIVGISYFELKKRKNGIQVK